MKDSIIFTDTVIKKGSHIEKTIIDKKVVVGEKCQIGIGDNILPNKEIPNKLYTGLNLIGKFAVVPDETIVERNCRILSKVSIEDFGKKRHIRSGESIHSSKEGGFFDIYLD